MPSKRPEVPPPGGPERGGSPPCFADEADPDYMLARRMDRRELAGLLGALLDAERRLADALTELERAGALPGVASARVRAETAPLRARLSAQAARLRGALGARPASSAAVPEADDPGATLCALHRYILREIDRALPLIEEREAAALLRDVRTAHARALAETEPAEGQG